MKSGKRSLLKFVVLAVCLFSSIGVWGQSFSVDAPNVVGVGEVFQIVYTADADVDEFVKPSLSGLTLLAGPTPSRMQSYSSINGKTSSSLQISYTIVVRATAAGKAKVSPASVKINGRTLSSRALDIDVVADGSSAAASQPSSSSQSQHSQQSESSSSSTGQISSSDAFLNLAISRGSVVKGEPVVVTLKLYVKNVNISGFEDVKFPVFNGFWSQELEVPQNISFVRENYNGQIYNSAVLRKWVLLPQKTGSITIDPAEIVCQFQVRAGGGRRSMFDDFFDSYQMVKKRLFTKSVTINVRNLPQPAPADFGGGVGQLSMKVSLGRDSIPAHEAGTITVELNGSGNLNLLEAPKIQIPSDFEQYDMKTTNNYSNGAAGMSGSRTFEFPFIPRSEGVFEIPAVTYSYYNIKSGKYETLKSQPLTIKVTKGSATSAGNTVISGMSKQAVANLGSDIRYISNASASFSNKGKQFIGSLLFFACIALLVLLVWAGDLLLCRRARLKGDVRRTANRKANKVANARLKSASAYLAKDLGSAFYEELHKALLGYVSDKLAIKFADMQRDTIEQTLVSHNIEPETIGSFMELLDECEMARYSSSAAYEHSAMQAQFSKAVETISSFENKL